MQKNYILPIIILLFLLVPIASAMDAVNVINPPGSGSGNTYINNTYITSQMNQTPNQTAGQAASITINNTVTLPAGSMATVVNIGSAVAAIFDIGIPKGAKGDDGAAGYTPIKGVDYFDGVNGTDGIAATVAVNHTFTIAAGSDAVVVNVGNASAANLDFSIPSASQPIGSIWYLHNEPSSDLAGMNIFSRAFPTHAEGSSSTAMPVQGTEYLLKQFVSEPNDPSLNALPAGQRIWTIFGSVTANTGMTDVVVRLYKYNTSTTAETELYNLTVGHFVPATTMLSTTLVTPYDQGMLPSDRFLVKVYAKTTANNNPTFTLYYDDSSRATQATSPINQGTQGAQGEAATIYVNQTTTGIVGSNASVINVGTIYNASLNFVIPTGATGAKGDPGATGGTGGQVLFYRHADSTDPITYEGLVPIPFGATEVDENGTINDVSGKVLIDAYITDVGYPAVTKIPAGLWIFRSFGYVSAATGSTTFVYDVYNRTAGGTETLLFSVTSPAITSLTVAEHDTYYAQAADKFVATSDRIVVKVSVQTTKTGAGIVYHWIYEGNTHNSNIQTPLSSVTASALSFGVKSDGTALYKGQAVYISGASGGTPIVDKVDNTVTAKTRAVGLVANDVAANTNVNILRVGVLTGVDTRSTNTNINPLGQTWTAGDLLFATTGGGLTNVRPTSGRSVKAAYTLTGSSATDSLLAYPFENPVWVTAASAEDVVIRLGDIVGVNKLSIRNYTNAEVAHITSQGYASFNGSTMQSKNISSVHDPVSAQDAATKNYVDTKWSYGVTNVS